MRSQVGFWTPSTTFLSQLHLNSDQTWLSPSTGSEAPGTQKTLSWLGAVISFFDAILETTKYVQWISLSYALHFQHNHASCRASLTHSPQSLICIHAGFVNTLQLRAWSSQKSCPLRGPWKFTVHLLGSYFTIVDSARILRFVYWKP